MTTTSSRPRARLRVKLLALLVSALSALLLAEALLWALTPVPDPLLPARSERINRYVSTEFPPNEARRYQTDGRTLPGVSGVTHFTLNAFGFRSGRLRSIDKPADVIRVFCVGGSTTECLYLDDNDQWPEALHRILATRLPAPFQLDVVNCGRSSDTSRDHVALLSQRLVEFAPDVVIFLVAANEPFPDAAYSRIRRDDRSYVRLSLDVRHGFPDALKRCLMISQLMRRFVAWRHGRRAFDAQGHLRLDPAGWTMAEFRRRRQRQPHDQPMPADARRVTPEYPNNLRTLIAVCRAHGILPVFLTQPYVWRTDMKPEEDALLAWARYRLADHIERLDAVNRATQEACTRAGVLCIDLEKAVPKAFEYFYDDMHFNVKGSAHVAEFLGRRLIDAGVLEKAAARPEAGRRAPR